MAFEPDYHTEILDYFTPMLSQIFSFPLFNPVIVNAHSSS